MRATLALLTAALVFPVTSAFAGDDDVKLSDVPAPVRTVIDRETKGGRIEDVERKMRPDKSVYYEIEWEKDDVDHELHIDGAGKILKHERD